MTTAAPSLPVDSLREAASFLRRPFTVAAVKFKPQSHTKSGKTLCVAYIDARLVYERLNMICPHLWQEAYQAVGNQQMWCHLTIDGITHSDIGEGTGKALVSDAVKRAAVHFGVGVSLYAVPQMLLPGKVEYLYPDSREYGQLRAHYSAWLDAHGKQAFGEPLDHGDVEGAQGDHEVDPPPGVDPQTGEVAPPPAPKLLTKAQREKVEAAIADYSDEEQSLLLSAVGVGTIAELTVDSATELRAAMDARAAQNGAPA